MILSDFILYYLDKKVLGVIWESNLKGFFYPKYFLVSHVPSTVISIQVDSIMLF